MSTAIDAAGRLVIPKALRDAMGLTAGKLVDITYADGRLEIELAPAPTRVDQDDSGLPVLVAETDLGPLTGDQVRATIEAARR